MMLPSNSIQTQLIEYLSHVTAVVDTLLADTPIIQSGLLDSLTLLDLVHFIESSWGVRLSAFDINSSNFRDIQTLASVINERMTSVSARAHD